MKLKLVSSRERFEKYRGWSNYEIAVKYDGNGFWASVYFKKAVKPVKPRTLMTIDLNLDNVTLAVFAPSGKLVRLKRFKTPLKKMLTHKIWIERVQGRYPKSWRFIKGARKAIEKHGERIEDVSRTTLIG
jgi:hypothetical protein